MPGLFHKKDPREQMRKITSSVRRQKYAIQRETNQLMAQRKRLEADIKKRANENRLDEAKILARELIAQRKAIKQLYMASSQLDTIVSELQIQTAMGKMAGCMKQSTTLMKAMSQLVKIPQLQNTMRDLSKEMAKMGLMQEMMEETMDSALGDEQDMGEAIDAEVNRIIGELTTEFAANAPDANQSSVTSETPERDPEIEDLTAQLEHLRN
ncbi:Charged multivesicular body protein 3 [Fasciola hepatica]|uniref:Charged multivesicular body protein 3 n=1 Tax=Fasciola hepatica TaxID=6192 RepID=A0A4E0R553_FASHE|nr:Charged multivesicular body protein 3 [Fasciola hepatica]